MLVSLFQKGGKQNKTMNNAHINYILPRVSVRVKKMAKRFYAEKNVSLKYNSVA